MLMQTERKSTQNYKIKSNEQFSETFIDNIKTDDVELVVKNLNNTELFQQVNVDGIAKQIGWPFSPKCKRKF